MGGARLKRRLGMAGADLSVISMFSCSIKMLPSLSTSRAPNGALPWARESLEISMQRRR